MTTSVLTFAMVLDAILANLRAEEDEEDGSDVAVKGHDRAIGEFLVRRKVGIYCGLNRAHKWDNVRGTVIHSEGTSR